MDTVKLRDIAEKTGFSISTVSRILSGDPSRKMKAETIEMVLRTADEMGYYRTRKNKLRKSIPEIRMLSIYIEDGSEGKAVYPEILEGILEEVKSEQTNTRLEFDTTSIKHGEMEGKIISTHYDAAILVGNADGKLVEELSSYIPDIVHVGLNPVDGIDDVITDFRSMMKKGYLHLKSLGRTNIAYVGSTSMKSEAHLGYLEGRMVAGDSMTDFIEMNSGNTTLDGYESAERLLDSAMPDAIVTTSDNIAIGILKALKERNIRCPEDIAIIGCGDLETSAYMEPSLSTFSISTRELGVAAVRVALERLENPRDGYIRVELPFRFLERESTVK